MAILLALAAFPLGWLLGGLYALGALALAGMSFFTIWHLSGKLVRAGKERLALAEQLLQSQKLAAIGELAAGIAHEINNPLAIIRQEGEWLRLLLKQEKIPDPGARREFQEAVAELVRQVDRSKEIIDRLLNFARRREPVIQAVDLNRLIRDMTALVEREARHHNIEIVREFQADLPLLYSDPPLLRQVILNLLTNATYAVGKDGRLTIVTRLAGNQRLEVLVKDTGRGIPPEDLPRIFDPFFTTKPEGKGTGLGLAICHGIIHGLGGEITVKSEVGKGTAFTISLPLKTGKGGK